MSQAAPVLFVTIGGFIVIGAALLYLILLAIRQSGVQSVFKKSTIVLISLVCLPLILYLPLISLINDASIYNT